MSTIGLPIDREPTADGRPGRPRVHPSTWLFALAVVVAVPVILVSNRDQWFFLDDWDFLAGRDLGSARDLLRPHNEHWTTLPVIQYRVTFAVFGIEHYWPYQLPVIAAHLLSATLLRIVMLRSGVGPWLATAASLLLLFFGSGRSDIATAFQVTFTGALALGLCHLLLADHDGPIGRRDVAGLVFGAGAIMCSGIGPVMVVVVGVAALVRRGFRPALLHTAPLGVAYVVWLLSFRSGNSAESTVTAGRTLDFWRWSIWDTFLGAGQWAPVGVALLALAAIGLASSVGDRSRLRQHALPLALLVGAATLLATVAAGRASAVALGSGLTPDRYVYLVLALALPTVATGAAVVSQRWRGATIPLCALILAGLPGNIAALTPSGSTVFLLGSPEQVRALASAADELAPPPSLQPDPVFFEAVTAGWLVGVSEAGQLPSGGPLAPAARSQARLQMSLEQQRSAPAGPCRAVEPGPLVLARGDRLRIRAEVVTVTAPAGSEVAGSATYYAASSPLEALLGVPQSDPVHLRAAGALTVTVTAAGPVERCGP